ncbi:MAG: lmo0937 family membrane protein, partial [Ktedonobacteraceae bacterium]
LITGVQYFVRKGVIIMLHTILWGILILVLVIWLLGFFFKLAGGIIRILIAIAAIIIIVNVLSYLLHWF